MSDRVPYPRSWSEADKRALDEMFREARTKDMLFYSLTMAGELWYTPDQLETEQKARRMIWIAGNWRLRSKQDRKDAAREAVARAGKAFDEAVRVLAKLERSENEA